MAMSYLVAFDFDHTIVEDNTDIVIRRLLKDEKALAEIKGMYQTHGWTIYMEKIFEHLHANGITCVDIEKAIAKIPGVNGFPWLLQELHKNGVEIVIISDSNSMFINHWLKSNNVEHTVNEVFTNPAWFDDTGLLKIKKYHIQDWCKLSEKNMCKGHILQDYIKKRLEDGVTFNSVAYVGDGRNDLCAMLGLSSKDFAFPRLNYPLMKILNDREAEANDLPVAQVIPWTDGMEIWKEIVKMVPHVGKTDCAP